MQLTPVAAKELGDGFPILQVVGPCKDGIEALVIVHIWAGDRAPCLACVQSMTLQQPQHIVSLRLCACSQHTVL